MDELTLLRSIREDEPPVGDGVLAGGRAALLERIAAPAARRRRVRPRIAWAGGISIAATAAAAVLVAANLAGIGGGHGGAAPAAAEVLHQAAAATIRASDPVVPPGHFLQVTTKGVYAAGTQDAAGHMVTYLASQDGEVFIPADRQGTWVWVRDPEKPVQTFGPDSQRAADHDAAESGGGEYLSAPGGAFYGTPISPTPAELASLPTVPEELLQHIRRVTADNSIPSADDAALGWIADALRTGIVPAEVRGALYEAAADIPGVTITDRQATLDGRTGIAIGRTDRLGGRREIIIDPDSGLLIGERQIATGETARSWNVPSGTAIGWTAITTQVVAQTPARG